MSNLYEERDIIEQGDHYSRHVSAMTGECLHSKSAIAAELAHRDIQLEQAQAESVQAVANMVCGGLPEGWVINLCMENGAAWVEVIKPSGYTIDIDRGDMSLVEQIDEALRLADEIEKAGGEK